MRASRWGIGGMLAGAVAALPPLAMWRADQAARDARERLDRIVAQQSTSPLAFSEKTVAGLPAPVIRYFSRSLREGEPPIRAVELVTDGEFRMSVAPTSWRRFHATQRFTTDPPGFVWNARIAMAPLVPVIVRDAYVDGSGEMVGKVLGLYTVVDQRGAEELALGELTRYLAETIWFPTALLPRPGLAWQPLDEHSAIVTIADRGRRTSLRFTFDAAGDVTEVFAKDRLREINGRYVPTPWAVRCWRPEVRHGIRIPTECESEWRLDEGPLSYWRGRVSKIAFEYADSARR